jgi:hypothetical protein
MNYCSICGCSEKETSKFFHKTIYGDNLCNRHYYQIKNHGHPIRSKLPMKNSCDFCDNTKDLGIYYGDGKYFGSTACIKHRRQLEEWGEIRETRYDQQEYFIIDNGVEKYCEIIIKDNAQIEKARTLIDFEDIAKAKLYKWHISSWGYAATTLYLDGNKSELWLQNYLMNTKVKLDHKDRNKLNNRKKNLRPAQKYQNNHNRDLLPGNKSGITGVFFCKDGWFGRIQVKYIRYEQCFDNKLDAIIFRLKKEKELLGEFAPQKHLFEKYGI